jgi:phospholipid transport system substrate-binding protein
MVCASFLLLSSSHLMADTQKGPDVILRDGINEIIDVILKIEDRGTRFEKVKEIFFRSFDLPRLAGMTLGGTHWRSLDMKQKVLFTEKYSDFVLTFYLDKLESYDGNKVKVGSPELKSKGKKAIVPMEVEFQGNMAKLNYSMVASKQGWKIYDVEVEGVRLSTTYRNQFVEVLEKSKFDGLIAELERLTKQASTPKP